MCEYIKRSEAIKMIEDDLLEVVYYHKEDAIACLECLPTADVAPRSEVMDEFADRLKEKLFTIPTVYNAHFRKMIDAVMAEMKGGV